MRLSEKERYEAAVAACSAGDADACKTRNDLAVLSLQRDQALQAACSGNTPDQCNGLISQAKAMGNFVQGTIGGVVYANSPEQGAIRGLNTTVIGPSEPNKALRDQHEWQAAVGTPALTVLSGGVGAVARGLATAQAGLQIGTGIGQVQDGNAGDGALNIVEGGIAAAGAVATVSTVKTPAKLDGTGAYAVKPNPLVGDADLPNVYANQKQGTYSNALPVQSTALNGISVNDITAPVSFTLPAQSQIISGQNAGVRLGAWGEGLGNEILNPISPGVRTIQTGGGKGIDGIGGDIDHVNMTIPAFEIKTTDSGNRQSVGTLDTRMRNWIDQAADTGQIGGQSVSPADRAYAKTLQTLLDSGYTIKPYVVEVAVPAEGQSARPVVTVIPWPRPAPMPKPSTAPVLPPAPPTQP